MAGVDVVVGRQPIFDRGLLVIGYELLFRTIQANVADATGLVDRAGASGDQMTAEVIFGSVNIGIDRLVGQKKLFCNASRGVVTGDVPILLPASRTVVEVIETITIDEAVLAGCRRLRDDGFALALDDFSWRPGVEPLLELASIVKIDPRSTSVTALPGLLERCRRFDVALLASKVETADEMDRCEALGFDYFQGNALGRPRQVPGRALDPGIDGCLRMAARLLDLEYPIAELETFVCSDPAIAHQLLQLAGIGAVGETRRHVRTIREALVLVGWRRLQSWIVLLLIAGKGRVSREGITTTLTRARMCELAAAAVDPSLSAMAFTAGMVASFDVLLGVPIGHVLESLPLGEGLRAAILHGDGPLGRVLTDVTRYLEDRPDRTVHTSLDDTVLSELAIASLTWAVETTAAYQGS